jgi:hypothetical protein
VVAAAGAAASSAKLLDQRPHRYCVQGDRLTMGADDNRWVSTFRRGEAR